MLNGGAARRVLLVDDETSVRTVVARFLTRQGYEVALAESGEAAIHLAKEDRYPIVVTDIRMPGVDGLTLIERLRNHLPNSVYLVLTGIGGFELEPHHNRDDSIAAVLRKPWKPGELISALDHAFSLYGKKNSAPPLHRQVLLLEDNPGDADLMADYLLSDSESTEIHHFSSLEDAIGALHNREFSIAVVDLSLPDAGGMDVVERVSSTSPELPLLVLSGRDDPELALRAVQSGAQDYLIKQHINPSALSRATRYAIERKNVERKLAHLAYYDPVTGLPNRSLFYDRLGHAIAQRKRDKATLSVMFLDLDRFKSINDEFGHTVGDQLLKEVGARLRKVVRETDTVARLAGDEFAVLLEQTSGEPEIRAVGERIVESLKAPIKCGKHRIQTSTSVGVALFPEHGYTAEGLLKSADGAMYLAKRDGRSCYRIAGEEADEHRLQQLRVEFALERGEFQLSYLPRICAQDSSVVGFSTHLSWNPPGQERLGYQQMLPIMEEVGLMKPVGTWAMNEVCSQIGKRRNLPRECIALELSATEIDMELPQLVAEALEKNGVAPGNLQFRLSSQVLHQLTSRKLFILSRIVQTGVSLALNCLGEGPCALSKIGSAPLTAFEIGPAALKDEDFSRGLVAFVHGLGQKIVATSVESPEQAQKFEAIGCDQLQGTWISAPLTAEQVQPWLSSRGGPVLNP